MNKCICDICGVNEADNHFKVKQLDVIDLGEYSRRWIPIDICKECYTKLISEVKQQKQDDCEYYVELKYIDNSLPKGFCYGTKDAEECFCHGKVKYCTHYPEKRNGVD